MVPAGLEFDPSQVKVLGDVFPYAGEGDLQEAYTETQYVIVFTEDDNYYRVYADLPKDVSEAIWAIDFDDEDKDQKIRDLISPLEISKLENLTEQIPPQEELDKLVGKTGQELFDDGWEYWYYDLDEMEAGLNYGPFSYTGLVDYDGPKMKNSDDFDFYAEFKDLTVKSVAFEGIGDATDLEN